MFRSIIFIFSLAGLLIFINCSNECPDSNKDLGYISIQPDSFDFFPYSGKEVLIFEDSVGNTKVFQPDENNQSLDGRITVELTCTNNLFNNTSVFYSYQGQETSFQSGNDFFYLNLSIGSFAEGGTVTYDTILYDYFIISGYINNNAQIKDLGIIVNERGNAQRIPTEHREIVEQFEFITDTVILNRNFENVYKNANKRYAFIFKPKIGVVAIIDNGNPFLLRN